MATMVIVALALAVMSLAIAVVAGGMLWRSVAGLRRAVESASDRLEPLRSELAAEQATLQLELDGLERRQQRARRR